MWTSHYIHMFHLLWLFYCIYMFQCSKPNNTSTHFAWCRIRWLWTYHYIDMFFRGCRTRWVWTYHYIHTFHLMSHSMSVNLPLYPHISVDIVLSGCEPTTISTHFGGCRTRWVWTYHYIHAVRAPRSVIIIRLYVLDLRHRDVLTAARKLRQDVASETIAT